MVLAAGVDAGEGVTLTEVMMPGVEVGGFVVAEPPPGPDGAFPLEFVDGIALGAAPLAPLHPQPQSVRVIRKMTSRKYRDLFG